jgi:hypothetical protein
VALTASLVLSPACGSSGGSQDSQSVEDSRVDAHAPSGDPQPAAGNRDQARASRQAAPAKPDRVRTLTGARTRVVWIQDIGEGTDIGSRGDQLILMGYDSHDGLGERPILSAPANYAKPLITPLGNRVVFSDRLRRRAFVVNWDGSGLKKLGKGFALATWIDPNTQVEWVYMGTDKKTDPTTYGVVTRYQIDRWDVSEVVWKRRRVSGDTFQVSADGRLAGGLFPWPAAGVVQLPKGAWDRKGRGCWTSLAGGGSPLFWYFDGSHRNLTIVDLERDERWKVNINNAPGIDGYEIYHPRWSNHPRFLTITGPYTVGKKANKIRGGGEQVEIYLGRFAADFTAVESWVKVSDNERADFYPDAWIDPSERPPTVTDGVKRGPGAPSAPPDQKPRERLVVQARVLVSAPIPTPKSILPYRRAMLVNEYEIVKVLEGSYQETKILVAHWVIRDGQVLDTAARARGTVHRMTLGAYDEHHELEGERLVMDSDEFDLRLYYDINS